MKKILVLIALGSLGVVPGVGASPVPAEPELWVMDADGTDQRMLGNRASGLDGYGKFSWSPDSTRIVASGLVVIDVSTGEVTRLDPGGNPDWSPVADEIVFGADGLYLIAPDGSNRRLLVDGSLEPSAPAWSPDGERVAFVSGPGSGRKGQVFVVDSDGSNMRKLTTAGSLYKPPTWSPDGDRLAFETFRYELHVVNADGTGERPVGDFDYSSQPTWCPDGTLYFAAQAADDRRARIYSMNESGEHERLVKGFQPSCSPSGLLAYSRDGDVYLMDPGEPGDPNLTTSEGRSDFGAEWSPDASKIAFVSLEDRPDPIEVERRITLSLDEHLVIRGRLRAPGGGCEEAPVKIQRRARGEWKLVEYLSGDVEGRFEAEVKDRPGSYRAVAPRHPSLTGDYYCLRAASEIARHRH